MTAFDLLTGSAKGLAIDFTAPPAQQVLVRNGSDVYKSADQFLSIAGNYSAKGLLLTPALDPRFLLTAIPALGSVFSIYLEVETQTIAETGVETWLSLYKASDTGKCIRIRKDVNDVAGRPPWIDLLVGNGAAQANLNAQCVAENLRYKIAGRLKANDFAVSFNGGVVQTDTSGSLPALDNVRLGSFFGTSSSKIANDLYIRSLVIVPGGWTNAQLRTKSAVQVEFSTKTQADLINEIWSGNGLPTNGATNVATSVTNPLAPYSLTPANLLRVDRLTIAMDDNAGNIVETSQPWVFRPTASNGKLAIFNCGHTATVDAFNRGEQGVTIKRLVEAGYTVIAKLMPFAGSDSGGTVANHDSLPRPTASLNHLKFFIEPNVRAINELMPEGFTAVVETGLSGGGWTVDLHAAVDERVAASASVAGSLPLYMINVANGPRDWEQLLPSLGCDFHDLYVMECSNGRKHLHVLNSQDPSVFWEAGYRAYTDFVPAVSSATGGRFGLTIYPNSQHSVSAAAQNDIVSLFNSV